MLDEKGHLVVAVEGAADDGRLPPGGAPDYLAALVDDGGNAGVGTAGYASSGLDGPEGGV